MDKEYISKNGNYYYKCNPYCANILKIEYGESSQLKLKYPSAIMIDGNMLWSYIVEGYKNEIKELNKNIKL